MSKERMSKKIKLNLKELTVQSFVTSLDSNEKELLQGGAMNSVRIDCQSDINVCPQ